MDQSPRRIPFFVVLLLALAAIGGSWWGIKALQQATVGDEKPQDGPSGLPPASVVMTEVGFAESTQTARVLGTLHAKSRAEVAAREAGPLLSILVDEGDSVEKDAPLARLDPRRLEAQIAEAQADITVAEAFAHQKKSRVKRSSIDLAMKEKLFSKNAISESEVLDARSANNVDNSVFKSAQDSLKAAQSRLELLRVRQEDLEIRAPFSGKVVARHVEPGEWLTAGDPVATLVSDGEIEAWLQVPERFAKAARGKKIPVTLTATGESVTSTDLKVVPEAQTSTRTLQVIATLPNPDGVLVPGLSVSAELPVSERTKRLSVPVNAVVQGYAGPGVFSLIPQEKGLPLAKRIPVKILYQDQNTVFLEAEELNGGDRVVVEGNERLIPGQPLMISERPKAEQPPSPKDS